MPKAEQEEKKSLLDKELERIEKDYGRGSVISLSMKPENIEAISTGSLRLDLATGIGGLPRGRIVEIMGWESSGKSTITLQTMANAQKMGLKCLLIDGEYSFDTRYATALGIKVDDLLICQPGLGGSEEVYNIAERLIRTGEIGMVVIDSQTSLLPKKALEEDIGTSVIGLQARIMGTATVKILNAAAATNTLVVYISQFREKVGIIHGPTETTSGGNALKFYAHMRIDVRKYVLRDSESKEAYANKTTCKVIKNKMAVPFKEAEFRINFGEGVDRVLEVLDLAVDNDIMRLSGSHYYFNEIRLANGEDNTIQVLKDNPELANEIETLVLQKLNPKDEKNTIEERIEAS